MQSRLLLAVKQAAMLASLPGLKHLPCPALQPTACPQLRSVWAPSASSCTPSKA
jgi:hypothetical protein